jgi:hypothetical protein
MAFPIKPMKSSTGKKSSGARPTGKKSGLQCAAGSKMGKGR